METIHAGRRRSLPPVPRTSSSTTPSPRPAATSTATAADRGPAPLLSAPDAGVADPLDARMDPAQRFVARLRAAAPWFAEAAGAESAVVREVVPPARHRRSRCRVVLREADGSEQEITFLGPAGNPALTQLSFDGDITRWLGAGRQRDEAWLVPDPDAPGGSAIDLTAWRAAG